MAFWSLATWNQGPGIVVVVFTIVTLTANSLGDENRNHVRHKEQQKTIGTVAHELHTPLAAIRLLTEGITKELRGLTITPRGEVRNASHAITMAASLMAQTEIAHDLLEMQLANAKGGGREYKLTMVDLGAACAEAIHKTTLGNKSAKECISLKGVANARGVAEHRVIVQVLINLINNAYQAIAERMTTSGTGLISIVVEQRTNEIQIAITDNGVGIKPKDIKRIFEPFYTSRGVRGHGLGLSFVREAVNRFGGTVKVTSKIGVGTRVTIALKTKETK